MKKPLKAYTLSFLMTVVALILVAGCNKLSPEDKQARIDDKAIDSIRQPEEISLFPNTPLGKKLTEHMVILATPSENMADADKAYAMSLEALREFPPKEVIETLSDAYGKAPEALYFDRWGLVKTMGDLNFEEAIGSLALLLKADFPEEKSEDLHHFSTQEEELVIRIRAVEGLANLAALGHRKAESELLRIVMDPATEGSKLALKKRAIKGYLKAGDSTDAKMRFLKERLPEEFQGWATLDVTPLEELNKRVQGLVEISEEGTNTDANEEKGKEDSAPTLKNN